MKISYLWLREFVETDLSPREVADQLVNAGIEVAAISPVVEGLSGVVIAEIEAIERDLGPTPAGHQNRLCRVRLPDRTFSVICGAPNAAPGLRRQGRAHPRRQLGGHPLLREGPGAERGPWWDPRAARRRAARRRPL